MVTREYQPSFEPGHGIGSPDVPHLGPGALFVAKVEKVSPAF